MQTKEQCTNKIKEMLIKTGGVYQFLFTDCIRLLNSGGISLDNYNDDYLAPQIIIICALKNLINDIQPLHKGSMAEDIENLSHF